MAEIQQRVLILAALAASTCAGQPRFYPDDPLPAEPPPVDVGKPRVRKLNDYYDFFRNQLGKPGEKQPDGGPPVWAQNINTIDEVPDSAWYTNRHYRRPMTDGELRRGPGNAHPPSLDGPWKVLSVKSEGITPGFSIEDSNQRKYLLKVDPPSNPEMATAADVIGSKLFYALGYNTPENYIVEFGREQLGVSDQSRMIDDQGVSRLMNASDIDRILLHVPKHAGKKYRAMASLYLPGDLIGAFRYDGTRSDDPNDVIPHEHRRELRGLKVFSAWVDRDDSKSLNTLDTVVSENGVRFIKHYEIDFGSDFGSDAFEANSPRAGYEYLFAWKPAAIQFVTFGFVVPRWARAHYDDYPSVGRFESTVFDPERWVPNYYNPAYHNMLPDDAFWAAKQVMAFTDQQIRVLVDTGSYSDPAAAAFLAEQLARRRDKIGRTWFSKVLPLDHFRLRGDTLEFDDLGVKHGFAEPRRHDIAWSVFDNGTGGKAPLRDAGPKVPATGAAYLAAEIAANDRTRVVNVYLRHEGSGYQVVGVEHKW